MTVLSRSRVAVAAGLTLGTAAASLVLAPAALAAHELPALEAPGTVVAGATFSVAGTDCTAPDGETEPAIWYADFYSIDELDANPDAKPALVKEGPAEADGTWTVSASFAAGTAAGDYVLLAGCEPYTGADYHFYPEAFIDVTAASVSTPTATPTPTQTSAAPTGAIRGASANTPGIAVTTTKGASSAAAAAPGTQITKVLKGFKPGEKVTVVLHSTPTALGTFTALADGTVTATFTVPAGTAAGSHTLVFEGNQGSYYQEAFAVAAATTTASSSGLAYTGADVAVPLTLGGVLVLAGAGALLVTRRRTTEAPQA